LGGHSVEFIKYLGSNYEVVFLRYEYPLNRKLTDKEILSISTFDSLKKRKGLPPFHIKHALGHPPLGRRGEGFMGCCSVGEATTVSSFVASCG
jgi:hypothetical protein